MQKSRVGGRRVRCLVRGGFTIAVLSDESMPELTGIALAREIGMLRPDLPVVLMSGFGGAQLQERAAAVGVDELLRKPLQRRDLAECLERVFPPEAAGR